MNIAFTALKYAEDHKNAGLTRKQAQVRVDAMLAQNAAFPTELKKFDTEVKDSRAKKHDLTLAKSELQVEIEKMRYSLLKWHIGIANVLAAIMARGFGWVGI